MSAVRWFDILIAGAGHAGAQSAILLRQLGFEGSVGLIGAEADLPYERPPLSKEYLAGEKEFERMLIRPAAFWTERRIELVPNTNIVAVDAAAKTVTSEAGESFGYGSLIWATGIFPASISFEAAPTSRRSSGSWTAPAGSSWWAAAISGLKRPRS
jgi:3-phenylpropionate/trans-cinnamate dioxygenase ferredoxin reductase subunit